MDINKLRNDLEKYFVMYYGEELRTYIRNQLQNLNFIFYNDPKTNTDNLIKGKVYEKTLYDLYTENFSKKKKPKEILMLFKLLMNNEISLDEFRYESFILTGTDYSSCFEDKIKELEQVEKFVGNNGFWSSINNSNVTDLELIQILKELSFDAYTNGASYNFAYKDDEFNFCNSVIFNPSIYDLGIRDLFFLHEVNHAITTRLVADNIYIGIISEDMVNDNEILFVECINHLQAIDICKIMHDDGYSFYPCFQRKIYTKYCLYDPLLPLVRFLYKSNMELFKNITTTADPSLLFDVISEKELKFLKDSINYSKELDEICSEVYMEKQQLSGFDFKENTINRVNFIKLICDLNPDYKESMDYLIQIRKNVMKFNRNLRKRNK